MNPRLKRLKNAVVYSLVWTTAVLSFHSCFTGIESTPKITANDVKRENIREREENSFLSDISSEPFANWQNGKEFYVTDDKISIIFGGSNASIGSLKGKIIKFESAKDVIAITGEPLAEISFSTDNGDILKYRSEKSLEELKKQADVSIPFTIEETLVRQVRAKMEGKKYYVLTSMWYDINDQSLTGRKFIPVKTVDVLEGNSVFPIKLVMSTDEGVLFGLFMTVGTNQKAPRSFGSLFSFDDPHLRYPTITDETWRNIINGRVALDMTRDECRLALGSPATVSRQPGYDYLHELWTYENGVYLVFQDGLLKSYRK